MAELEHSHEPRAIARRLAAGPSASYLRDWVYGGIDGAVTTFAIVAGVAGADLSQAVILILGVANLLADGFSMAASNYSGTRAEIEEAEALRRMEDRHIDLAPEGEREEVRQILAAKGFTGADLDRAVAVVTADRARWIAMMMADEHGIATVPRAPLRAAGVTFAAFVLCGSVPLIPFATGLGGLGPSVALAALTFFGIGAVKARWSPRPWWWSGAETAGIGLAAAGIAYAVGAALRALVGI